LEENSDGFSLVELISELRARFEQAGVQRGFDGLLMVMGYLDDHADLYGRRLTLTEVRVFRVEGQMPRLMRSALPAAIRSAAYVLDLDALEVPSLELQDLIIEFGLD
jgi:hypothetical protein